MSTKETDLYADNNLTKTFIAICTPKRWCYVYVILVYVLTVYLKNVSIIWLYIDNSCFILIICNTLIYSVSAKISDFGVTKVLLLFFQGWDDSIYVKNLCIVRKPWNNFVWRFI